MNGMALIASQPSAPTMGDITTVATSLLSWLLTSATSIVTWIIGNPLALTLTVMFIVGFAIAALTRILRSAC